MFRSCNNSNFTTISATDTPNLSGIISLAKTFENATNLQNINNFNSWNVSNVLSMATTFSGATSFNENISSWDVSSVTNMSYMFSNASSFNQDISSWDVSSVTTMSSMFRNATSFNQNLSTWNLNTSSLALVSAFRDSGMSTANYTDTIVGWANYVNTNSGPYNVNMGSQISMTFDTSRSGGANFADAGRARSFLTLDVTVSGGSSAVNGVYYYDYANDKWVSETDANAVIEWNSGESSWDLSYEGTVEHAGSGGTEVGGPESSTSWSGGLTVVDSSKGWSITSDAITT